MAANISMTLSGWVPASVTGLRLDGTPIPINADRTWRATVPVATRIMSLVAILADGRTTTRVIQLTATAGGAA